MAERDDNTKGEKKRTSKLAIISFLFSIAGFPILCFLSVQTGNISLELFRRVES